MKYNNANEQAGSIHKGVGIPNFQGVGGKQAGRREEVNPDTGSVRVLCVCVVFFSSSS